jgi:(S)-sulfolactate dehydrogenase
MADIIIAEAVDLEPVERLKARYSVHYGPELWRKREELEGLMAEALAIIVRNACKVDAALIAGAPRLRVIGRHGVGLDNVDMAACRARGIEVCPAIGANSVAVAEYAIAAALMLLRGKGYFGTARVLAGEWPREDASAAHEAEAKVFGLIGLGAIGEITARKSGALGFHAIAYSPSLPADHPAWQSVERVDFAELLARADVVSIHCPLSDKTRGLIGREAFAAMRPGAILINTARGGIIDEAALAEALRGGRLGGAALDVLAAEPITPATAALFAGLPNLLLTPHIAGSTVESSRRVCAVTVDNVLRVLSQPASAKID